MLIGRARAGSSFAMVVICTSRTSAEDLRGGEGSGVYGQALAVVVRCEFFLLIALACSALFCSPVCVTFLSLLAKSSDSETLFGDQYGFVEG